MRFHHTAIEVSDLEKSITFYVDVCGFRVEQRVELLRQEIVFLKLNSFRLELVRVGTLIPHSQSTHLSFEVIDIDHQIERMKKRGLSPIEGPYSLPNGWRTVFYEGPDAECLEFLQTII